MGVQQREGALLVTECEKESFGGHGVVGGGQKFSRYSGQPGKAAVPSPGPAAGEGCEAQGWGQVICGSVVCPHDGTTPGAVAPARVPWLCDPVPRRDEGFFGSAPFVAGV